MSEPALFTAVSFYSLAGTVAILGTAFAAARTLLPKTAGSKDRVTFVWLAFDALIHLIFEGSFLFYSFPSPRHADAFDAPLAKMWQEYGRADTRWAVGDSTVVSLELLTVLGAGPLCWYLLYQLIKGDRARYYWLIVLSTAELYGGFMTFCPEWITGNQNLHTANWLHFWVYLMFFNLIWVFIPLWIMYDSYGYIVHSLRDPAGYAAELTRAETVAKLKPKKSPTKKAFELRAWVPKNRGLVRKERPCEGVSASVSLARAPGRARLCRPVVPFSSRRSVVLGLALRRHFGLPGSPRKRCYFPELTATPPHRLAPNLTSLLRRLFVNTNSYHHRNALSSRRMSSAFALTMTPTSSPPASRVASRRGSAISINRPPLVNRGSASVAGSRASSPQRPVNPESEFIGSIDCGTSSCRFYIFDQNANVICWHQKEFEQLHIEPGWHEHDPLTYTKCIDACIVLTLKEFQELGYRQSMIKGIGIAVQRETVLVWDRTTGKPLHNAIAWPDARNAATVRALKERAASVTFNTPDGDMKGEDAVRVITGLPFSTYFSATKYAWLLENCKEVQEAKENGNLMIGTVDAWLLWIYTGGVKTGKHITDLTNASRTLLLSLHTQQWDDQLLDFFDLPRSALPTLASNSEEYGRFFEGHILEGIPIAGLIGDQQAALVGNKCLEKGSAKQTYGTGCFMLYNTGSDIVKSTHGLLTTVGYKAGPNAQVAYALEGSVAVGGSSVQWLRDNLGLIKNAKEAGELAEEVEDTGGVYFVTGFSGLFAPYWDMAATGMLIGLSTYTTKHHICRATLEATCFQTRAILEAMTKDTQGHASPEGSVSNGRDDGDSDSDDEGDFKPKAVGAGSMKALKVDGGMTASDVTMQLQADILGIRIERPTMRESTALGAALLAGSALNLFGWDLEDPSTLRKVNEFGMEIFMPSIDAQEREWKFAGWNRAVNRAMAWKTNSGHG